MAGGFIHSQVLAACVRLGLFGLLRNGAMPPSGIAAATGLPQDRIEHLLRAAAALRLLEVRPGSRFGLGVLGAAVVDNPSIEALIEHHELLYRDLADPVVLFAEAATATHMQQLWPYATSGQPSALQPSEVSRYTDLMATSQAMIAEQVFGAYSLRSHKRLMDIGGGSGAFLTAVAARWPHLELTLVDLPAVASIASERLESVGLKDRVRVVAADARTDELPHGFDVVSLVRILHDHNDDTVIELLAAARGALARDGVLLVAEPLADAPGAGPLIDAYFNVYLLAMGSGRPRTFAELSSLLGAAGYGSISRRRTHVPLVTSVVLARRGPGTV